MAKAKNTYLLREQSSECCMGHIGVLPSTPSLRIREDTGDKGISITKKTDLPGHRLRGGVPIDLSNMNEAPEPLRTEVLNCTEIWRIPITLGWSVRNREAHAKLTSQVPDADVSPRLSHTQNCNGPTFNAAVPGRLYVGTLP